MRILMLGWEFPPFISGGLGTACHGLTRALDRKGHEIIFVLPRMVDAGVASHVRFVSPGAAGAAPGPVRADRPRASSSAPGGAVPESAEFERTRFVGVRSRRRSPYAATVVESGPPTEAISRLERISRRVAALRAAGEEVPVSLLEMLEDLEAGNEPMLQRESDYEGDVIADSKRYARMVTRLCRDESFDVIHAHDWMTYPAGMALARLTGRPLIAHIHSTEFDRSGESVNQRVYDIERRGMHAAMKVIAVSMLTKKVCVSRYGLDPDKIEVVYNGVECGPHPPEGARIEHRDRIVLFLGRITMQKGPEYFVGAARRVLEKLDDVKFIVAGSGDQARRTIELAAQMGIGHKVLFTGFLRGRDVARVFHMADCFVMPSVSEPFGIVPLEALSHDVPVIISKQSGVSEVLTHALKVDFWDVDEMANKIVAVLRHPPLSQALREHGYMQLRRITWDGAADRCGRIYESALHSINGVACAAN